MKALPAGPDPRDDRPATRLLHDEAALRAIAFHLRPGQEVARHTSPSTVLVQVTEGSGTFCGDDGEVALGAGEAAVYRPGEPHSMRAGPAGLRFVAVLAPGPSA